MSTRARQLDAIARQRRIPDATYRLQFNRDFTLAQATEIAPYLRDLGISDCYASPLFQATPRSTHGYDVCCFDLFNPWLGTPADFDTWSARLRELGLGLILDMVPNHMGADLSNHWWADVLQRGRESPFASFFDIDWQPPRGGLQNKVLLPTLEDHYATVLEAGKLRLVCQHGLVTLAYHDRQFPIAFHSCAKLLEEVAALLEAEPGRLPLPTELSQVLETLLQARDSSELAHLPARIQDWDRESTAFHEALERVCQQFNGQPGRPRSFDKLDALLRAQHYRLAFWRVGSEELNYRRFFDVTDLVSLRMEHPLVFQACQQRVFHLLQQGQVTGLRIDHPDGLWDPKDYFRRLQAGYLLTPFDPSTDRREEAESDISGWLTEQLVSLEQQEAEERPAAISGPGGPTGGRSSRPTWPLFVVAEKILSGSESLRRDWAVEGTTGYDFLNHVSGLLVDASGEKAFDALYFKFTDHPVSFGDVVYASKKHILESSLVSEWNALALRLKALAERTRYAQDLTLRQLRRALAEILAALPVYRTYVTPEATRIIPREQAYVEQTARAAKTRLSNPDHPAIDFIQDLLLLRPPADFDEEARRLAREFVLRFQQLSGPAMAKGLEDTAFYRYNRLISLNEVGGDPSRFGVSLESFHEANLRRAAEWPHSLLATATHDTKRGEDVRARLSVLSEMPAEWQSAIERWRRLNAETRPIVHGHAAPHPNDEYLLYQTLVGAWPWMPGQEETPAGLAAFRDRVGAYMLKATREAKVHTSWTDPNRGYEDATRQLVTRLLDPSNRLFLDDFRRFQRTVALCGAINSLAQLLLKMTCPGVPDFYQGTELWDFSLVDPDNRHPVDYTARRRLLDELRSAWAEGPATRFSFLRELLQHSYTGQIKLHILWRGLDVRRRHRHLFSEGAYLPIQAWGPKQQHVCAFARTLAGDVALTIVPRLPWSLTAGSGAWPLGEPIWQDTRIELTSPRMAGHYTNALTGEEFDLKPGPGGIYLSLGAALAHFPLALLER